MAETAMMEANLVKYQSELKALDPVANKVQIDDLNAKIKTTSDQLVNAKHYEAIKLTYNPVVTKPRTFMERLSSGLSELFSSGILFTI